MIFRLYDAIESGVYYKWEADIIEKASHIFDTEDEPNTPELHGIRYVVKVRSALGPFGFGLVLSLIVFSIELILKISFN